MEPTPTGEPWTVRKFERSEFATVQDSNGIVIERWIRNEKADVIVAAHNAALAAEREAGVSEIQRLHDELAAERDKNWIHTKVAKEIEIDLAAERIYGSAVTGANISAEDEIQRLRSQLAAEREKRADWNVVIEDLERALEAYRIENRQSQITIQQLRFELKAAQEYAKLTDEQLDAAVEALRETRAYEPDITPTGKQKIDAALAKLQEGK